VRVITIQHEKYGGTVHLFIGMGRSLGKITSMPSNIYLYITMGTLKLGYPLLLYEDAVPARLPLVVW
jgi:hypothetical protein